MSRKIALPLLVAAALPPEEADAPTALLTQTEEAGG